MSNPLLMGAVAYDPKVVAIWEGFKKHFCARGLKFDYVLYSNYERLVRALFDGHVHVAWNSPLAWLQAQRIAAQLGRQVRAIAMRDTDIDLRSVIVVRSKSDIHSLTDLRGKVVAAGAGDSPQATLIPLWHIEQAGLETGVDFQVQLHERRVGFHGDHIGDERDAAKSLAARHADAACMFRANHELFIVDGTLTPGWTRVLAETGNFDHCNLTVLDGAPSSAIERFTGLLLEMSHKDPKLQRLLDMEGLECWTPGRSSGYDLLAAAIDNFGTVDAFVASFGSGK